MRLKMSKQSRQELLEITRLEYQRACGAEKRMLLDGFTKATGYNRKYAIGLLGEERLKVIRKRTRKRRYDESVVEALKQIWIATNRIASKRLIPFLPTMIEKLEKHGHLSLTPEIRIKLLKMSASTVDRLLKDERHKHGRSRSTTRPGRLLKKHIPVRTFADWEDAEPGFFEADLVSHCGGVPSGTFLNTLTMTDISSGWIEMLSVNGKCEERVLQAFRRAAAILPFPMKGLDTDNGSEFMNFSTIEWCEKEQLTFTRAREYKKNDQAHVEEKNGSVVRRLVGYERFEGETSMVKLTALYAVARLYINFFQPSMKLINKEREGATVRKRYDKAQTPYQRLMNSTLSVSIKRRLRKNFEKLNPVALLQQMEQCQIDLWATAVHANAGKISADSLAVVLAKAAGSSTIDEVLIPVRQHQAGLRARSRVRLSDSLSKKTKKDSQAQRIRDYIMSLPAGKRFRAKDLSLFGTHASAVQQMKLLVRHGEIVRLKWGCYCRAPVPELPEPFKPYASGQAEEMRRFIFSLPIGEMFRVEDLLQFGSRASAKQLLRALVLKKVLIRLQPGRYATVDRQENAPLACSASGSDLGSDG